MSSLKDRLPQETLEALKSAKDNLQNTTLKQKRNSKKKTALPPIEVGNIYKIEADERNGITPPHGRKTWFKHFVVMGISDDGSFPSSGGTCELDQNRGKNERKLNGV